MKRGDILIGFGAGLVSALLFATVIRGSLAGMLLFYLTPLPIAIASLGWDHRSGLIGSVIGSAAVAILFDPLAGAVFAVAFALPVWWLSFLTLLAQDGGASAPPPVAAAPPAASLGPRRSGPPLQTGHWYPLGGVALWAAGLSVLLTLAGAVMLGPDYAGYQNAVRQIVDGVVNGHLAEFGGAGIPVGPAQAERIASLVAGVLIPASAGASLLLTIAIMLIAAKIVALSGRLPRPMPRFARDFAVPAAALVALAVGALLGLAAGWPRVIAIALAAVLTVLLALQGLATAHVLLARVSGRPLIVGAGYAMLVIAEPWMLIALAALGLADMALSLRRRSLARSPDPI